jgi:hypothetical protein
MEEIKITEEDMVERREETIKRFAQFLRELMMREKKSSLNENPNEVRICVTEDLNLGEKLGG